MFVIVKLLYGTQEKRECKENYRESTVSKYICAGRGYKKIGVGGKGIKE
jgi:hypothetical protein